MPRSSSRSSRRRRQRLLVGNFGNGRLIAGSGNDVLNGDAFGGPDAGSRDLCVGAAGEDAAFPGTCEREVGLEGAFAGGP